jgi:hypothetical protein
MDDIGLFKLLQQSREKNKILEITGILLYFDGNFMQLLEGTKRDVKSLYNDIRSDDRHKNIVTVVEEEVTERLFPEWSMAFKATSMMEIRQMPAYKDITESELLYNIRDNNNNNSLMILQMFKEKMAGPPY